MASTDSPSAFASGFGDPHRLATLPPRSRSRVAWAAGRWLALFCCALAVEDCGGHGPVRPAVEVKDSSGVLLIDVPAAYLPQLPEWSLAEPPVAQFGADGPSPLFHVSGAVLQHQGTIAVANSGLSELDFFDRDGDFIRSTGRKGDGPGEFQLLTGLWSFRADSLAAFDWATGRISVFDSAGHLGRTFRPSWPDGMSHRGLAGFLGDSAPVLWLGDAMPPMASRTGVYVDSVLLARYSPDGTLTDTIGRFPDRQWYVWTDGHRSASFALPFGWSIHAAVHGGAIYVGTGERYEILRLNEHGELQAVTRLQAPRLEVSGENRRDDRERRLGRQGGAPYTREMVDAIPYPPEMPAYTTFFVDGSGRVWVRDAQPSPEARGHWTIFDRRGRPLARLLMPPRGSILDVGDMLVGVWRDESDVETVGVYQINRGAPDRE
jgi:hypothetical protein